MGVSRWVLFIVLSCILANLTFAYDYGGGTGTPEAPYKIRDANDLLALATEANDYNDSFVLINDINLANYTFTTAVIAPDTNNSDGEFQGIPFTGIYDGNNHSIINLTIDTNGLENDFLGLFGWIDPNGIVKNLGIEGSNVIGNSHVGSLAGLNSGGIANCYNIGIVMGYDSTGGLVALNEGNITNCYSQITVNSSTSPVGGLVAENRGSGNIVKCYSVGDVNGQGTAGGLVGHNGGYIMGSHSGVTVIDNWGPFDFHSAVGGLVGSNYYISDIAWPLFQIIDGNIKNCYSTGNVSGNNDGRSFMSIYIGGLVGDNSYGGTISNCYSTGEVTESGTGGTFIAGGLCGGNDEDSIIGSSYFLDTSGPDNGVGLPLTDEQMKDQASYIDWDFSYDDGNEADWFIQIDEYPILTWQISPADLYADGRNDFKDFALFSEFWMREDCSIYNYYCEFSDLDLDGDVDIDDLFELMGYWLETGIYD